MKETTTKEFADWWSTCGFTSVGDEDLASYAFHAGMQARPDTTDYILHLESQVKALSEGINMTILRDQFAMAVLTGFSAIADDRTYCPEREDCIGLTLEEWQEKTYLADARYAYRMADAMLKVRKQ